MRLKLVIEPVGMSDLQNWGCHSGKGWGHVSSKGRVKLDLLTQGKALSSWVLIISKKTNISEWTHNSFRVLKTKILITEWNF